MRKIVLAFCFFLSLTSFVIAQSVQDGVKYLYYDRVTKAKETLQKAVASNSKDPQAIYWLGQALLADKDVAGAKAVYQKALQEGVNDPYIWVGMGHVQLLEGGDINAAKQKFEQAITATKTKKGEDPNILNAIGRANADGGTKFGDAAYGVEKLKRAAELDTKSSDIYYNMGVNYLKMGSERGGDAVEAFQEAIKRNPADARSMYRIGRIYESQANTDLMNEWYGKAVSADANYAPAYLQWFLYYSNRNVNTAKEYLDKYMNIMKDDRTCETDYFYADYLFRAGKYQESIAKANEMANGNCKDFTKVQLLYAYNYDRLGDTIKARQAVEKYFAVTPADKIIPEHLLVGYQVLKRFPDARPQAAELLKKAFDTDTIRRNRMQYADTIAYLNKLMGRNEERFSWLQTSWSLNPNPSNFDIYNIGEAALNAKKFSFADSMFTIYKNKYPDQSYGYLGKMKVAQAKDSTGLLAIDQVNDYINFLMKDTAKNAPAIAFYHATLGGTYVNSKKDYEKGLEEFDLAVKFDPANAQYKNFQEKLRKVVSDMKNRRNAPPRTPTPPRTPAKPNQRQ